MGVSVFPAGVDETDTKRGAPKNQKRRETRSQRRGLARRALRKRRLRNILAAAGLLPETDKAWDHKAGGRRDDDSGDSVLTPWQLRREGLTRPLTAHEFGRVLVHLNQRRGALGVETNPDDPDEGKVKEAIDRLRMEIGNRKALTFGQFMADLMDDRAHAVHDKQGKFYQSAIRNRRDAFEFHADRALVREEFGILWDIQKSHGGQLAKLLTDDLREALDAPSGDRTWRHRGAIFEQRRTYWDSGTLGRCDLEPTDHRCPVADMYAQEYRVVETVNNIRIEERGTDPVPLTPEQREKLIAVLRKQKTGSVATVRRALGMDKRSLKKRGLPEDHFSLNIDRDKTREINTDWFYREIVHGVFTETRWSGMPPPARDSVNMAILKLDPENQKHTERLLKGAIDWWKLPADAAESLVDVWKSRPKIDRRLNLSRRAIRNLLPYMCCFDETDNRWPTQIEARERFAEDADARDPTSDAPASDAQRDRYRLGKTRLSKADRQFLQKHPDLLPPAPTLANPVVRKAVHEVRRHVMAFLRRYGRKPDRIVIELARSATQPEHVRNSILANNRKRESERKRLIEQFKLDKLTTTQQARAVQRILLCREQQNICAYSQLDGDEARTITDQMAADGSDLEVDHIVPMSRSQDNSMNNKVLCFRDANREKGNDTPREWLSAEQFDRLEQRYEHWKKEQPRKWENLHREPEPLEQFINSQLTNTAYAATQVGEYLRGVLYGDCDDRKSRVFFTNGTYTAILRRDWALLESDIDTRWHGVDDSDSDSDRGQPGRARKREKDRSDHRHHAIDALAIAFAGPETIQNIAGYAKQREEARAMDGYWPRRVGLPPPAPWESVERFRSDALDAVEKLIVFHRPIKRKLIGAFHEETAYGPVLGSNRLFTNRIRVEQLTPNHLHVPDGWDELSRELDDPEMPGPARRAVGRELARLEDHLPGKPGIVRDRSLRDRIRKCLREKGIDPDAFSKDDIKHVINDKGGLRMRSGIPIKSVILLRTHSDPVILPRKRWDSAAGRMVDDPDPRTRRVYVGGNNHHLEIREDQESGRWSGVVVTAFEAARRVRRENGPAVDRSDGNQLRFVMSLSEGEIIHARRNDRQDDAADGVDYYVVAKLYRNRVFFAPHWDARKAAEQDRWSVAPSGLKECGPQPGHPPYKVRVSPLGTVTPLDHD